MRSVAGEGRVGVIQVIDTQEATPHPLPDCLLGSVGENQELPIWRLDNEHGSGKLCPHLSDTGVRPHQ